MHSFKHLNQQKLKASAAMMFKCYNLTNDTLKTKNEIALQQ